MQDAWDEDLTFEHPDTGNTTVIQDTGTAAVFLTEYWSWQRTTEYHIAVAACVSSSTGSRGILVAEKRWCLRFKR